MALCMFRPLPDPVQTSFVLARSPASRDGELARLRAERGVLPWDLTALVRRVDRRARAISTVRRRPPHDSPEALARRLDLRFGTGMVRALEAFRARSHKA